MKKSVLLIAPLLLVGTSGCTVAGPLPEITLNGESKELDFSDASQTSYRLRTENLSISDANITIQYANGPLSVSGTYCSGLDQYEFKAEVSGNDVILSTNAKNTFRNSLMALTVTGPIESAVLDGAYSFDWDMSGLTGSFDCELNGAFDADFVDIVTQSFNVDFDGAGDIKTVGFTDRFEMTLDGVAAIEARTLIAKDAIVNLNGVGSVSLSCTDTLNATINGVGSVSYYGSPIITQKVNGLGDVKQASPDIYSEAGASSSNSI